MKILKNCLLLLLIGLVFPGNSAAGDRLVIVGASYGKNVLAICDADGSVIWRYDTAGPEKGHAGHHDLHLLENGNLLFHDSWTITREINLEKKIVWEYDSAAANPGQKVDVHAFDRLPDGETVIAESSLGRIIHLDKNNQVVKKIPLGEGGRKRTRLMRLLDNGNYLVCAEKPGVVTEYDETGTIAWEYPVNTRVYGAIRLRNGNTLIATGDGNSIIEVNPDKEVVWELVKKVPGTDITLGWMTMLQELSNGNFLIGNCHAGEGNPQIFEITRDKKVVWEFGEWELVGNGLACWEVIDGDRATALKKRLGK